MFFLKILNLLFGLGISRYAVFLNDSAHESMKVFDQGFSGVVSKIKELGLKNTLDKIGSFFGWMALIYLTFFFVGKGLFGDGAWQFYGSLVTLWAAIMWFSIKWFTKFQSYALNFLVNALKFFSFILLMPVLDFLAKTNMTSLFYNQISTFNALLFGFDFPLTENSIYQAGILFAFYVFILLGYWVISSVYLGFIAGVSLGVVGSVVYLAKVLDIYWSKNHLTGFFVIGYVVTSAALWFA
ncbi:hypothetical protein [Methylophaga sp. SB9B]|uniref:hypothetical protein n=1 Tax=Methylophaga sp. SB9B TaxID=2570356 RepID=UPI0010A76414|nr:hypothetical protein [Methylophaga sp. SB9B]